jgi:serine/threonine protein kinase
VKLSESFKRVFYVSTDAEKDAWMEKLTRGTRNRDIDEHYVKGRLLGEGFFGKVYAGHPTKTPDEKVAIKVINKQEMQRHELHLHLNEIEMLKVCADHPSVLKLVDYFEDASFIHLVTELIEGPDLFDYIKQVKVDEMSLKEIMKKLLNGLGYLHNLGAVHRDLKLENIMIGISGDETKVITPKLIDFGLSIVLCPGE